MIGLTVNVFVVDALDERLVGYYEQFGLHHIPGTRRLFMRMSSVRKALASSADGMSDKAC